MEIAANLMEGYVSRGRGIADADLILASNRVSADRNLCFAFSAGLVFRRRTSSTGPIWTSSRLPPPPPPTPVALSPRSLRQPVRFWPCVCAMVHVCCVSIVCCSVCCHLLCRALVRLTGVRSAFFSGAQPLPPVEDDLLAASEGSAVVCLERESVRRGDGYLFCVLPGGWNGFCWL